MPLWIVSVGNAHVILNAWGREDAKRKAESVWFQGINKYSYTVTPLTEKGDRIHIAVILNV